MLTTDSNGGFQSRTESIGDILQLYPFDEHSAFTCEPKVKESSDGKYVSLPDVMQLFSMNGSNIVVSDAVYGSARARYGLATNQLFLGSFEMNVFYWVTNDPLKVYFRAPEEGAGVGCFLLPKGIIDIYGGAMAAHTGKDVGFMVLRRTPGIFTLSPNEFDFLEFSFKDAKRVPQQTK